jgi:hypothetical protein
MFVEDLVPGKDEESILTVVIALTVSWSGRSVHE